MSRWEFMRQLEELLSDISPSEREEALQYYNDYINDAGRENEAEALKSLGSPEQVARSVKEGLGESFGMGEFTENGFTSGSAQSANPIVKREASASDKSNSENAWTYTEQSQAGFNTYTSGTYTGQSVENAAPEKEKLPTWAIVLIVIGCIIFSPVLLGIAGTVLSVVVGAVASLFGIIIGVAAAAVALLIAGIALIIAGFGGLFTHPLVSIGLIGAGLICAALSILFAMLEVFLCGICLPGIFKGLAYIFKKLFGKKEVA
ncbi:MAG: hypothetical protein IJ409_01305 [Lachnospiraceae bacterium]|nr:hypothetical protein [Lachnospiraceae bacterium]